MIAEHRAHKRVDIDGGVRVLRQDHGPRVVKAYLDDVSLGGFQMYAMDTVNIGEEIDFELMTPLYRDPLTGRGKVTYSRPVTKYNASFNAMGVEFKEVPQHQIRQLLKIHAGRRSKPGFLAQHKKELYVFAWCLPLMVAISMVSGTIMHNADLGAQRAQNEQAYMEKAKDALLYFLYHSQ